MGSDCISCLSFYFPDQNAASEQGMHCLLTGNSFKNQIKMINIKSEMRSFKSNENIHKKEGGSYYEVSANKAHQ